MAPEQIEGKEADARSDIFAFGAVLYEMTTGSRPFHGKSQISLASSILEKDPDPITSLKPLTPSAFEHVVTTCLQKNPEDRFQAAHDIKLELQWIAADRPTSAPSAAPALPADRRRERLGWAAAILAALIIGTVAGIFLFHHAQPALAIRAVINPPDRTTLNLTGDAGGPPVLSPDGSSMVFAAKKRGWQKLVMGSRDEFDRRALSARYRGCNFSFLVAGQPLSRILCRRQVENN
jgi:serine/threonine protein kinase